MMSRSFCDGPLGRLSPTSHLRRTMDALVLSTEASTAWLRCRRSRSASTSAACQRCRRHDENPPRADRNSMSSAGFLAARRPPISGKPCLRKCSILLEHVPAGMTGRHADRQRPRKAEARPRHSSSRMLATGFASADPVRIRRSGQKGTPSGSGVLRRLKVAWISRCGKPEPQTGKARAGQNRSMISRIATSTTGTARRAAR